MDSMFLNLPGAAEPQEAHEEGVEDRVEPAHVEDRWERLGRKCRYSASTSSLCTVYTINMREKAGKSASMPEGSLILVELQFDGPMDGQFDLPVLPCVILRLPTGVE